VPARPPRPRLRLRDAVGQRRLQQRPPVCKRSAHVTNNDALHSRRAAVGARVAQEGRLKGWEGRLPRLQAPRAQQPAVLAALLQALPALRAALRRGRRPARPNKVRVVTLLVPADALATVKLTVAAAAASGVG
jgi:hypothetical protein